MASNGDLSGTPVNADVGTNNFTVSVSDGPDPAVEATLTIGVLNTNDAPVASDDSVVTDEDFAVGVTLMASDVDGDDVLTYTVVTAPANGTLSGIAPDLTYTPDLDYNGMDSFTFTANDGTTDSNTATISLTINAVNDAPVFGGDPFSTSDATEDVAYSDTIAGSAADVDGETLTYAKVAGPSWLIVAGNGDLSGTPLNEDVGSNSFTVSASDGTITSQATLTIEVFNTNDVPTWNSDPVVEADVIENNAYSSTLSDDASDVDGDTLSYAKVSGPIWLIVATDGALSGTPTSADVGTNSFTVSVSDGEAPVQTVQAMLTIEVLADTSPPTLTSVSPNDGAINVATDAVLVATFDEPIILKDGGNITITDVTDGSSTTVITLPDTRVTSPNGDDLSIDLGTALNFSNEYEVTIDTTAVEDQASAQNAYAGTLAGEWTFTTHAEGIFVTNTGTSTVVDNGSTSATVPGWSLNGGNAVVLLFGGESGKNLSATYGGETMTVVEDATGNRWVGAVAYIINPAASTGDIVLSWSEDGNQSESIYTPISLGGVGGVAAAASRDTGNELSFNYTTTMNGGYVVGAGTNNNYAGPAPDFSGNWNTAAFDGAVSGNCGVALVHGYVATAGSYTDKIGPVAESAAAVAFEAISANSSPVLTSSDFVDDATGGPVGVNTLVTYTVSFSEDIDAATVTAADFGNAGTASVNIGAITETSGGIFTVEVTPTSDGFLQLQVNTGAVITDLAGNALDTSTAIIDDTVIAVGTGTTTPLANNQSVSTNEDTAVAVTLTATVAEGGVLTYTVLTAPTNGILTGTAPDLTYTPNGDYNGSDSFTFKANDGTVDSNTATISLTINAVNDAPVVYAGTIQTVALGVGNSWTPAEIATVAWFDSADASTIIESGGLVSKWNDKSGNANHAVQATSARQPTYQAADPQANNLPSIGNAALNGSIGLNTPSFGAKNIYVVAYYKDGVDVDFDGYSTLFSGPGTNGQYRVMGNSLTSDFISTTSFNDAGTYKNGSTISTLSGVLPMPAAVFKFKASDLRTQDYALGYNQLANDRDWQGAYCEWIFTDGTEDAAAEAAIEGYLAHKWGLEGSLPAGHAYKNAAPVSNTVNAVADLEGTASDVDTGDTVFTTWSVVSGPVGGTVLFGDASAVATTATFDAEGVYTLRLTADDGTVQPFSDVDITVDPASSSNSAPVANNDSATVDEDSSVVITLTATDADVGDTLTYTVTTAPTNGTLSGIAPDLTYTPNLNYNGSDSFTFVANDGTADSNTATVSLTINAVNDTPVFTSDPFSTTDATEDTAYSDTIAGSATDAEGQTLTYAKVDGPAWLTVGTDGALGGTPLNADVGGNSFTVSASDGTSTTQATLTIQVLSLFEDWAGEGSAPGDDGNGDGVADGLAWVLGASDASVDATELLPTSDTVSEPEYFIFTYRRADEAHNDSDTSINVIYGEDMSSWTTAVHDGSNVVITETDDFYAAGVDRVEVKLHWDLVTGNTIFARLQVITP